jgi:hypothetical protein
VNKVVDSGEKASSKTPAWSILFGCELEPLDTDTSCTLPFVSMACLVESTFKAYPVAVAYASH